MKGVSLIVGADGLIGRALADYLMSGGESIVETTRRIDAMSKNRVFLDLNEDTANWQPPDHISVAYLCASVTSLEKCRKEPAATARVNVHQTVALTKKLAQTGAFVIFLSTNLVYDGSVPRRKADDAVCPVTEYGRQKAEAERQLLTLGNPASVVRFTKVLDPNMALAKDWLKKLRNHEVIHPYSDMVIAPIPVSFSVEVLHHIAKARSPGIFQVSGDKDVTYAEVARHIAHRIGASPDLVQPIESKNGGVQLETVPRHTTLDTTRLRKEFGIKPPDVWLTIDTVFSL
ncbi:MAG: sugar nucleotide-binding protein [Dehalococcoidales bacterium]|jgi:dTDP-4-dehydrorhamnose reductase